jgi:biotin synthase
MIRYDWTDAQLEALFELPFNDLLLKAHLAYRDYFPGNEIQTSSLLSIKTGKCPENCHYCPQSAHYQTSTADADSHSLLTVDEVHQHALAAKKAGATRFCMGAAWRQLHDRDLPTIMDMVQTVKDLGLESCMTLGMLTQPQADQLKAAGLDYYNHNLDTSESYYDKIITTRRYEERLTTLDHIEKAGLKTCCGGIVGMGETRRDRVSFINSLARRNPHPKSVPINRLVAVKGTPLANTPLLDVFEWIRTIAVARITMPSSYVRLSAGREQLSDEAQALCFFAGANSIFYGEKLLTTGNPDTHRDQALFAKLGLQMQSLEINPNTSPQKKIESIYAIEDSSL